MVAIRIFIPSSRWLVISLFIIFNFAANIRIISEKAKKKKENHTIFSQGSGDRFLSHPYTIEKWHVQQERIQIAESITPTAHLMNSSPTRSINIFKTETNQGPVT